MSGRHVISAVLCLLVLSATPVASQTELGDFGDAPEGQAAYPDGTPGRFPSCLAPTAPGTRETACATRGTAPGVTGFVKHLPSLRGQSYWFGCSILGIEASPGFDTESDARIAIQADQCGISPDCTTGTEWLGPRMIFGQDECSFDGRDAGLQPPVLATCSANDMTLVVHNDGATVDVYLNVLVDMNRDGDWNDSFVTACYGRSCVYEWALKNEAVSLPPGCTLIPTPSFPVIQFQHFPYMYPTWVRMTLTDDPVDDDFPWKGSAGLPGDAYRGGETEDAPSSILYPDPVKPSSWGAVKTRYR